MLIISYGIPKSGSTLSFELINGVLASAGHPQKRLPDALVSPGHNVNFLEKVHAEAVTNLVAAVPAGGFLCVKTHARIDRAVFRLLEKLQAERKVQVVASYRDPRDICLSLMDAGARAREKGLKAFSECTDLASVIPKVERQLVTFRMWAAIQGSLRLSYDLLAFSPDRAIDKLEQTIGVTANREAAKKHAFDDAFTQKNKAVRNRHARDLTPEQKAQLEQVFDKFLRRVVKRDDDAWFTTYRENFLAQTRKENA